jgi:hypothetical protein
MDEFDSELRRAFAALGDPADEGFTASVAKRVGRGERARAAQGWLNVAAFVVAGGAFAYGLFGVVQVIGPALAGEFGLGLAKIHGALTGGADRLPGLGAALMPLLMTAAAVAGGLFVARAASE